MRNDLGARLRQIRAHRTQQEMAHVLGVAHRTYANYEREERVPDAEVIARLIAEGWDANWLLTGEGPERLAPGVREPRAHYGPLSQPVSPEHLSIALELADEALQGLWLPRAQYAELVALIYQSLTQGLPYAEILDFARPAAKTRAKQGASDDGVEGVVQPSAGAAGQRTAGG